jgi:hypothetical protein
LKRSLHYSPWYRDRWNRTIVRGQAKVRNHNLKIKARVRARGAKNQWFNETRTHQCRQKSRSQGLWLCQFAGDFHPRYETMCPPLRPHYMRCMLVSNLAVENRFDC